MAQGVHVQQRADAQDGAHRPGGFGDPPAFDVKGQVRGKEPVVQLQFMLLRPIPEGINIHPAVPQIRQGVHKKPIA